MNVRIKKLEELEDALWPGNIPVGWEYTFKELPELSFKKPTVGERFHAGYVWSTSKVKEIIDEKTFKTWSSIYEWEIVE